LVETGEALKPVNHIPIENLLTPREWKIMALASEGLSTRGPTRKLLLRVFDKEQELDGQPERTCICRAFPFA
jgi:hypothetical protein